MLLLPFTACGCFLREPALIIRDSKLGNCDPALHETESDVVEFVAVRALSINRNPQSPKWSLIPKKLQAAELTRVSHFTGTWFGTRGSEVQILSPRPLKSIT